MEGRRRAVRLFWAEEIGGACAAPEGEGFQEGGLVELGFLDVFVEYEHGGEGGGEVVDFGGGGFESLGVGEEVVEDFLGVLGAAEFAQGEG